jgi:hypothetical protein
MRRDARKLLEKLSRRDFKYREFEDSFPDTELWPIFEIVLKDQRVVGEDAAALPARHPLTQELAAPEKSETVTARATPLFGKYQPVVRTPAADIPRVDLRDFFSRIAEGE